MGVEIRGMDKLRKKVNAMPKVLEEATWDATFELTDMIASAATLRLSNVKFTSGELSGSIKSEVVVNHKNEIVGRVWSDKEQAIYRELGTGPVGQTSTKDLPKDFTPVYTQKAWFIPVDATPIDLEAVYKIPRITIQGNDFYLTRGQPARPFLYPSFKEVIEQAEDIYAGHIQKSLKRLN